MSKRLHLKTENVSSLEPNLYQPGAPVPKVHFAPLPPVPPVPPVHRVPIKVAPPPQLQPIQSSSSSLSSDSSQSSLNSSINSNLRDDIPKPVILSLPKSIPQTTLAHYQLVKSVEDVATKKDSLEISAKNIETPEIPLDLSNADRKNIAAVDPDTDNIEKTDNIQKTDNIEKTDNIQKIDNIEKTVVLAKEMLYDTSLVSEFSLVAKSEKETSQHRTSNYYLSNLTGTEPRNLDSTSRLDLSSKNLSKEIPVTAERNIIDYSVISEFSHPEENSLCSQTDSDSHSESRVDSDSQSESCVDSDSQSESCVDSGSQSESCESSDCEGNCENIVYVDNTFDLRTRDCVKIIYANPAKNDVYIKLHSPKDENKHIIIKDITPNVSKTGTPYNIYISAVETKIEHYGFESCDVIPNASYGIVSSYEGTYVLNSSGGAVSFRFMPRLSKCVPSCWVIENQLIGNPRTASHLPPPKPQKICLPCMKK